VSQNKKRWKKVRKLFKIKLRIEMESSKALPIAIIKTYTAYKHRTHIYKIWEYLGHNHPVVYKGYCDKLMGQSLTGRDELFNTLCFACKELYDEFYRKIPERIAMGDALCVALAVLKEREKELAKKNK